MRSFFFLAFFALIFAWFSAAAGETNSAAVPGIRAEDFADESRGASSPSAAVDYEKFYNPDPALTPQEMAGVVIADNWRNSSPAPFGAGGATIFAHDAQAAAAVCAVMQVTDVELQAGEVVQSVIVGDSQRWRVEAIISGGDTPHVVIKPLDAGLETSMVIATDRRTYHLSLKSTRREFMSRVMFTYPAELAAQLAQQNQERAAKKQAERERNTIPETHEYLGDLNFNYRISGSANWKPTRVFTDGKKTVIEMPRENLSDAPVLLVKSAGEETLTNYRVQGNRYVVDTVFKEAVMLAGHGKRQQKITLTYLDYGKRAAR